MSVTIAAHTEPTANAAPGEVVKFVNISEMEDGVKITARGRDGGFIELELTEHDWKCFRGDVIVNG